MEMNNLIPSMSSQTSGNKETHKTYSDPSY